MIALPKPGFCAQVLAVALTIASSAIASVCTLLGDCLETALAPLRAAQTRAPASWMLAYDMARLQSRRGDRDAAASQWKLLAKVAREPEIREFALARLGLAVDGTPIKAEEATSR